MRTFSLPAILDSLFIFICSLALFLIVFTQLVSIRVATAISFTLSSLVFLISARFLLYRAGKSFVKKSEKKLFENTIATVNLYKESKRLSVFFKALKSKYEQVYKTTHGIVLEKEKIFCSFKFGFVSVSKSDVVCAFNHLKKDFTLHLYAEEFSQEIIEFCKLFKGRIVLKDGKELFALLKEANLLPLNEYADFSFEKKKPKLKSGLLNAKNAKKFFFVGLTFSVMSFIVPIKLYYILSGAIMMIFAIVLKLFGKPMEDN